MNLQELRDQVIAEEGKFYPAKSMADFIHRPAFESGRGRSFDFLMRIQKASLVMLSEEKIISEEETRKIRKAIEDMPTEEIRNTPYSSETAEDMFFLTEKWLMENAGECASNLHIGRSRNDIGSAQVRQGLRVSLLKLIESLNHLNEGLLCFARAHTDTLMLAYTHTQQAQPTTLGHYISAVVKMFERDTERLQAAYHTVNVSPMGAGAITTSGFPLNRDTMCELLGYDSVMENAYDCIAASDYVAEAASAVAVYALDYGRLVNNLLYWSAQEYGFLKTFRLYVGISSIMPQKRNPTLFEHLRSFSSGVYGDCQKVLIMQHNSTYEDDLDHMDSAGTLNAAMKMMTTLSDSLYNAMVTMEIDKELLEKNAMESFSIMTEFADMLVREEKVAFRTAHHVASKLVDVCSRENLNVLQVTDEMIESVFEAVVGRPLTADSARIRKSLDARYFVDVRTMPGGPAKEPLYAMLDESERILTRNQRWYAARLDGEAASLAELERRFNAL